MFNFLQPRFLCKAVAYSVLFLSFLTLLCCSVLFYSVLKLLDVDGTALPWCQALRDPQGKSRCVPIVQQICNQVSWWVYTFCTNLTPVLHFFLHGFSREKKKRSSNMYCSPSGPPIKFCATNYTVLFRYLCVSVITWNGLPCHIPGSVIIAV